MSGVVKTVLYNRNLGGAISEIVTRLTSEGDISKRITWVETSTIKQDDELEKNAFLILRQYIDPLAKCLGYPQPSFHISFQKSPKFSYHSHRQLIGDVSAGAALLVSMISVILQCPVPESIVITGRIEPPHKDIRIISGYADKFNAVLNSGKIDKFIIPDPSTQFSDMSRETPDSYKYNKWFDSLDVLSKNTVYPVATIDDLWEIVFPTENVYRSIYSNASLHDASYNEINAQFVFWGLLKYMRSIYIKRWQILEQHTKIDGLKGFKDVFPSLLSFYQANKKACADLSTGLKGILNLKTITDQKSIFTFDQFISINKLLSSDHTDVILTLLQKSDSKARNVFTKLIQDESVQLVNEKNNPSVIERYNNLLRRFPNNLGWQEINQIINLRFPKANTKPLSDYEDLEKLENKLIHTDNPHIIAGINGLWTDILTEYYAKDFDESAKYQFYTYKINSKKIITSAITTNDWLGLNLNLDPDCKNFKFNGEINELPDVFLPKDSFKKLVDELTNSNTKLTNRPAFRLISHDVKSSIPKFEFAEISYLQQKLTIGLLENELRDAVFNNNFDKERILAKKQDILPMRNILLPDLQSMIEFKNRLCTGGVASVLAIARGPKYNNDFLIPVYRRSGNVARNPFLLSIAPSGTHQAEIEAEKEKEVNIYCTIAREFYEELQENKETTKKSRSKLSWDWYFKDCPPLMWMRRNPEMVLMECVSFCINSFSGGFGFGVLWVILDPEFLDIFGNLMGRNWELQGGVELLSSKNPIKLKEYLTRLDWADECQMILVESLLRLGQHPKTKDRCSLPDIARISPKKI